MGAVRGDKAPRRVGVEQYDEAIDVGAWETRCQSGS